MIIAMSLQARLLKSIANRPATVEELSFRCQVGDGLVNPRSIGNIMHHFRKHDLVVVTNVEERDWRYAASPAGRYIATHMLD
jgi:hypothetical protein